MRLLLLALLACCASATTSALASAALLRDPQALTPPPCLEAARTAERDKALPSALLAAIGRVESGRLDTRSGQVVPWPWAVNAAGVGHAFATAQQAIAYVTLLQAAGVRSIDVGCFQVNLLYHPGAFASLEQAFDPAANASYAASFLNRLHARSGSWQQAVSDYHSMTPFAGASYRRRVLLSLAADAATLPQTAALAAWPAAARRWSDPGTLLASAAARSVQIIGPDGPRSPRLLRENNMPQVIRPDHTDS